MLSPKINLTSLITAIGLGFFVVVLSATPALAEDDAALEADALSTGTPGGSSGTTVNCTYDEISVGGDTVGTGDFGLTVAGGGKIDPGAVHLIQLSNGTWVWSTEIGGVEYRFLVQVCDGEGPVLMWFPQITAEDLLPDLYDRVKKLVPAPHATLSPLDAAGGWAYVQVPTDFRVSDPSEWAPVTARAQARDVWASVTATPTKLIFNPGDPANPSAAACGSGEPLAPYEPSAPGGCSYTYLNASSIASGNVFNYRFVTVWTVTTDSSEGVLRPPLTLETSSDGTVAVAEARTSVTE